MLTSRFMSLAVCSTLMAASVACSSGGHDDANDAGATEDAGLEDSGTRVPDASLPGEGDGGTIDAGVASDGGPGLDGGEQGDASVTDAQVPGGDTDGGNGGADAGGEDGGSDAGVCVPSAEICNAVDDDCDGMVDEGLLEMDAAKTASWDLPEGQLMTSDQRGFSQLLARGNDGAWLLTKALPLDDGLNAIDVVALDASGARVGSAQTILASSRVFIAASLDNYLAVLWRDTDDDGDASKEDLASSHTRLTVFEAGVDNALTEVDTFDVGGPADISELELQRTAGGELRVLMAYGPWANLSTDTLAATKLQTLRLDTTGVPTALVSVAEVELPGNARPTVHALKRPCAAGWLIGYWTNNGTNTQAERIAYFRPMTIDGEIEFTGDPLFSLTGRALQGVAIAPERCNADSTPVLVMADTPDSDPSKNLEAHELSFAHGAGTLTETSDTVVLEGTSGFARPAYYGGHWYTTIRAFATTPSGVYELDVAHDNVRNIATPVDQGGLSGKTTVDVNMYFLPTQGVLPVGDGMLVTFSNTRPTESPLGPETVAVSHLLACP